MYPALPASPTRPLVAPQYRRWCHAGGGAELAWPGGAAGRCLLGLMLLRGQQFITSGGWWLIVAPGGAIFPAAACYKQEG